MKIAAGIILASAACIAGDGDLSFRADSWEVRYAASSAMLTLTHPASGAVVEGELSFDADGDLRLAVASNRLMVVHGKDCPLAEVAFPRNGNRVGLQLVHRIPGLAGTLFFDGGVQYRADSYPGQSLPFAEERVMSLSSGDADSRLNDTLLSPSSDEALVVRCNALSLTSAGGGRYGLTFSLDFDEPANADAQFTIEPRFLAFRRWPASRMENLLPPCAALCTGDVAGERRILATQKALLEFPGVRPAAFFPSAKQPLPVWNLAVKRPYGQAHLVAVFNLFDTSFETTVEWEDMGEDSEDGFIAYELWNEAWQGVLHERLTVQVPPKDVRFFVLQPKAGHPQFLAAAGVTPEWPLKAQTWRDDVLSVTVALAADGPRTLRFAVPDSFAFESVRAPKGVRAETRSESGGRVLAVTLAAAKDGDASIDLKFK